MIEIAGILLTAGLLLYIFTPTRSEAGETKSRATYLRERKDAVYENLRDLNFETSRDLSAHTQVGAILAEIDRLEAVGAR